MFSEENPVKTNALRSRLSELRHVFGGIAESNTRALGVNPRGAIEGELNRDSGLGSSAHRKRARAIRGRFDERRSFCYGARRAAGTLRNRNLMR
jgi:hypothetical protein